MLLKEAFLTGTRKRELLFNAIKKINTGGRINKTSRHLDCSAAKWRDLLRQI